MDTQAVRRLPETAPNSTQSADPGRQPTGSTNALSAPVFLSLNTLEVSFRSCIGHLEAYSPRLTIFPSTILPLPLPTAGASQWRRNSQMTDQPSPVRVKVAMFSAAIWQNLLHVGGQPSWHGATETAGA